MHLRLRLENPALGPVDDVLLIAEPESGMDDVAAALNRIQPGRLFLGGAPLPREGTLAASGLLDGAAVSVERAGRRRPFSANLELAVVGGPLSGQAWPLPPGSMVAGRSPQSGVRLDHPSVSRNHFRITAEAGTCTVEDLGSTNGTWVGGRRVSGSTAVAPGQLIEAGACLLEVRTIRRGDADLHRDETGNLAFNRPARIRPAPNIVQVAFPAPPPEREPQPFPWVQVVAPLVLALVAVLLFRRPEFLLFALMSPVFAISNTVTNRRRDAARSGREAERYAREVAEAQARVEQAAARELDESRQQFPDPATLGTFATGPTRRLWERREHDPDAVLLRVGVADRPASIKLTGKGGDRPPDPPLLPTVPVTVDLAHVGVFGVAGPTADVRAIGRWLVAQLAILRSPKDLQMVLLTETRVGADWDWFRWLPHTWADDPQAPLAMVGNDKLTREERVKELLKLLDARTASARDLHAASFSPTVVVILDGVRALRALPGVPRLLREGPRFGVYAVGLDSDVSRLAEEGRGQLVLDANDPSLAALEVDGADPVPGVLVDRVMPGWADEVGRALAPIRDAGGEEGEGMIPRSVRYVDLAGIDLDRPEDVVDRWTAGGRTTGALVGVSVDGPFTIDLKRDGPHGLVAGTTGAGKSEFLQTLVVSLALGNLPAAMNFVLVDYKGASAFADCAWLPHTVGLVTNLDGHLTERALVSLDAELKRREEVLKDLHAPDIDTAWERGSERAAELGLGRLVIVIDEFAELVRELPEFVSGLIRIARVGRSLGVHLILATQRPAGVVSPEMRANTGLRVALRMEDKNDSSEVLDAPHAADISRSTPGRGFVRTGGQAGLVEFQTARVAGRRRGATEGLPPPVAERVPWNRLGYPLPRRERSEETATTATDLHALVELISVAADDLLLPRPTRPWLPPLPASLTLDPAPETEPSSGADVVPVVIGIEDRPAEQAQPPATFDLAGGGHLLVAGSARSGRSTALRTLAGSLARSIPPSDLHLYGLDFGNGALLPLTELPHCGAVITRSETDRIERLVERLSAEVARRQGVLAHHGLGDIAEQRRGSGPPERLPYIVVLVDRWEGFTAQFSVESASELPATMLRLVREGAGVGVRLVIAGDRTLLTDRVASQVEEKLVLRLADRDDYRMVGLNPRKMPDEIPPGRAFRGESGREIQIALLAEDPSGQSQAAAIRAIAKKAQRRWPAQRRSNRPFRVDALPSSISFERASRLAAAPSTASPLWALVGVGGDDLSALGVDLAETGAFLIAGPSKTGRSTAAATMARSLLARGARVVAVCPRPSAVAGLDVFVLRGIPDAGELSAAVAAGDGPVAIVIDDAEALARSPADDVVRDFLRSEPRGRVGVVVAGQLEDMKNELRGTIVEARKAKAGLLLSPPSPLDGDIVGLRLPRNLVGRMPPGRGLLARDGEPTLVQVPL